MAEPGNKIATSERRAVVDDLLLKGMPPKRIARYMREMYGETFTEKTVSDYRDNFFRGEKGVINQLIKAAQDLADRDPPPTSDREVLAQYFSFRQTHEDLGLLYDRIRTLRELAKQYPFDESYDDRISKYLQTAESIRTRVFRHQYEQIRRAILLNVGKKIVMAAVNVFLPYVASDRRKEAVERFEAIVKPLLGLTAVPDEPADIRDIRAEMSAASAEPPMPYIEPDSDDETPEAGGAGKSDGAA